MYRNGGFIVIEFFYLCECFVVKMVGTILFGYDVHKLFQSIVVFGYCRTLEQVMIIVFIRMKSSFG